MRFVVPVVATALVVALAGCAGGGVDVSRERERLLEADRAWAAAAAAGDVARVTTFWADDATVFFPGAPVARGKEAIGELVERNRALPGFALTWEPDGAVVAAAGDLGYTTGTFRLSLTGPDGNALERGGNYLTVWRRQEDGSWKGEVESTVFTQ